MNMSDEYARVFAENIVDSLRESIIILDHNMHIVSANRSFYRTFGLAREETEKRSIYELSSGQWDIPELHHLLESIIPEKASFDDFEVRNRLGTEEEREMLLNARQLRRPHGEPALILLTMEDVTEQRQAQRKLEESEAKYHFLVEDINSIIIALDSHGRIVSFNRFSEKLFGFTRDEVRGESFVGTIVPAVDSAGNDNTGIPDGLVADPEKYYGNESEGIRKDGRRIWFYWSAKVVNDNAGAVTRILIDGNDITDLKRTRGELQEKSATLDAILESVPEGIMITSQDHSVLRASRYMDELLGVPADRMFHADRSGRLDMVEIYEPGGARVLQLDDLPILRTASTGEQYRGHEMVVKHDGAATVLSLNSAPIRDPHGNVVGAVGGWRDVTERKRQMEEVQARKRVLDAVLEYTPLGIMLVDKDGVVSEVSMYQVETLGIAAQDLIGEREQPDQWGIRDPASLSPPPYRDMPLCRAIRQRTVVLNEEYLLTP